MNTSDVVIFNQISFKSTSHTFLAGKTVGILQTTESYLYFKHYGRLRENVIDWGSYKKLLTDYAFRSLPIWKNNGGDFFYQDKFEIIGITQEELGKLISNDITIKTVTPDTKWNDFFSSKVPPLSTADFSLHSIIEESYAEQLSSGISTESDIIFFDPEKIDLIDKYLKEKRKHLLISPSATYITSEYFFRPKDFDIYDMWN